FREHEEFHTYKATCVSEYLSDSGEEKFNIYAKSQCGKEMYACLWLIKRGINVMEYHLSPPTKEINWTACAGTGIKPESSGYWSTQGRNRGNPSLGDSIEICRQERDCCDAVADDLSAGKEVLEESPCPITGEYTGLIPDASGLCARLFSDCENPESMHYKVYNCYNASDVYEGWLICPALIRCKLVKAGGDFGNGFKGAGASCCVISRTGNRGNPSLGDSIEICRQERDCCDAVADDLSAGKEVLEESPCPITGEYTGLIPDASGLCARLFSDCENPESMHYKVYNCYNASDVYEGWLICPALIRCKLVKAGDRRYKCLGQWEENSVMYTYTERTDVPGHECFLGRIVNDQELFIQEAGVNCQRPTSSLHSVTHGMKLLKKASCYAKRPAVIAEGPPAIPAVPRHSWTPKYPQIVHTTPPPQLRNWQPTSVNCEVSVSKGQCSSVARKIFYWMEAPVPRRRGSGCVTARVCVEQRDVASRPHCVVIERRVDSPGFSGPGKYHVGEEFQGTDADWVPTGAASAVWVP
ncbi:unnamed protein product, partial [Notodromas monacha]